MKILKIILTTFILGGVLAVPVLGCTSESESVVPENQVVTVQRGDLTIDIAAAGNLALSRTEDLAFDLFYQEGTVEEVLVEEGDTVEEGQVLVKLDTEEWEEQLSVLEDKVTDAERELTAKKLNLIQKEINVINAENALEKAEDSWLDTVGAGTKVRRLEERLEWYLENEPEEVEKIREIREDLEKAWNDFSRAASDSVEASEVTAKEMGVEVAKLQLEDAQISIEDVQQDLGDARETLEEAKSKSPIITAFFDGFITRVDVSGGDEVKKGTVAVQLADPAKFEADIMVSETDIFQVKLGGEAWVQVDAMPMLNLPALVTHISPTATIQSGVVNYKVKVKIQSLQSVMQEQQEARQKAMPRIIPEDFQLRDGLTVTVSILVEARNDVLLVPNAAITHQGGQVYVQVMSPDSVIEERSITIGISNWQYTEVTDGLREGEEVVVPQGTTSPTTSQPGGRSTFLPGRPGGLTQGGLGH